MADWLAGWMGRNEKEEKDIKEAHKVRGKETRAKAEVRERNGNSAMELDPVVDSLVC